MRPIRPPLDASAVPSLHGTAQPSAPAPPASSAPRAGIFGRAAKSDLQPRRPPSASAQPRRRVGGGDARAGEVELATDDARGAADALPMSGSFDQDPGQGGGDDPQGGGASQGRVSKRPAELRCEGQRPSRHSRQELLATCMRELIDAAARAQGMTADGRAARPAGSGGMAAELARLRLTLLRQAGAARPVEPVRLPFVRTQLVERFKRDPATLPGEKARRLNALLPLVLLAVGRDMAEGAGSQLRSKIARLSVMQRGRGR